MEGTEDWSFSSGGAGLEVESLRVAMAKVGVCEFCWLGTWLRRVGKERESLQGYCFAGSGLGCRGRAELKVCTARFGRRPGRGSSSYWLFDRFLGQSERSGRC